MKLIIAIILTLAIFTYITAEFFINANQDTAEVAKISTVQSSEVVTFQRLIIGDEDAPSTVVEYLDYKCPSCNSFHRNIYSDLKSDYVEQGLTNFEVRITPIIGPDSATAARGAYCANEQMQFVYYHNTVLDYMWSNFYKDRNFAVEIENILTQQKLTELMTNNIEDINLFSDCINNLKYNKELDNNLILAAEDEIRGTPGFSIGKQSFIGNQPIAVFKTLINIELDNR